jgi:hypothetical protein
MHVRFWGNTERVGDDNLHVIWISANTTIIGGPVGNVFRAANRFPLVPDRQSDTGAGARCPCLELCFIIGIAQFAAKSRRGNFLSRAEREVVVA